MLLSDLASSLRDSGVDVVSLAAGEPDFDTPQEIIDAGIEALRYERTHCMPLSIEQWVVRHPCTEYPWDRCPLWCSVGCFAGLESPTTRPTLAQEPSELRL